MKKEKITIIGATDIKQQPSLLEGTDIVLSVKSGDFVSDGYHTIGELYDHRITLFVVLCKLIAKEWDKEHVWRSRKHSDGELAFGGTWFVLGINRKAGEQITYHLPIERWEETGFADELAIAPEYDGHTSQDVRERLKSLLAK